MFQSYKKEQLLEFTTIDYQFILIGYPYWKAYVSYRDSNIWIETYFRIDVNKRIIFFGNNKPKSSKETNERSILDQLICEDIEIEKRKIEDFFNSIPEDIKHAVEKFPDSHWEAVEYILLLGKDLITLINTNPVVAYIIINAKKINPAIKLLDEIEILKKMLLAKQKEILGKCGFPETNQMVKIFKKIQPGIINTDDLINLRNLLLIDTELKERILEVLSFAKTINYNLLELAIYHTPLLTVLDNNLIYQLAISDNFSKELIKIRQMYLNYKRWKVPIPKINSLENLDAAFNKHSIAVEKKRLKEDVFPPPPLEDNFYVTALCKESELISWSKRQYNCIREYAPAVRAKKKYFYKVFYGREEATLEINLNDGKIKRGDLLGFDNKIVSKKLNEIVDEWFKEAKRIKKVHSKS